MESTPAGETVPAPTRPTATREYRATVTFVVFIVVILVVIVVAASQGAGLIGLSTRILVGPVLALVAYGAAAFGLSAQTGWARFAMVPLLLIVLVSGLISSVVAVGQGRIEIPIGSILAAWALLAQPSAALGPPPSSSTEGTLLVVLAFVAALVPYLGI